ncbi:hypothetical protein [Falsirhodobacter algicola]|uniref:Uncharacterized protein n=1 Tax=Falsirhodobacter algicola TaxID=2692330 RepID=A0A8J8MSP8_9RHOB|nr:hypothetical protein [Falsirhodobacter algicola]QUS35764.1 hypothetical protein GR316_05520 [Falsirhodobacter algicola]
MNTAAATLAAASPLNLLSRIEAACHMFAAAARVAFAFEARRNPEVGDLAVLGINPAAVPNAA